MLISLVVYIGHIPQCCTMSTSISASVLQYIWSRYLLTIALCLPTFYNIRAAVWSWAAAETGFYLLLFAEPTRSCWCKHKLTRADGDNAAHSPWRSALSETSPYYLRHAASVWGILCVFLDLSWPRSACLLNKCLRGQSGHWSNEAFWDEISGRLEEKLRLELAWDPPSVRRPRWKHGCRR